MMEKIDALAIAHSIYFSPDRYGTHCDITLGELPLSVILKLMKAFELVASDVGESDCITIEMHSDYSAAIYQDCIPESTERKVLLNIDKVVIDQASCNNF